jgi:hypothetical protein
MCRCWCPPLCLSSTHLVQAAAAATALLLRFLLLRLLYVSTSISPIWKWCLGKAPDHNFCYIRNGIFLCRTLCVCVCVCVCVRHQYARRPLQRFSTVIQKGFASHNRWSTQLDISC